MSSACDAKDCLQNECLRHTCCSSFILKSHSVAKIMATKYLEMFRVLLKLLGNLLRAEEEYDNYIKL